MDGFNYQPCSLVVTSATKDVKHAVAIALAQKNKGSLEAESIVQATSIRVQFRLSATPFCSGVQGVEVASDDLRDALSVIFGLSELKIMPPRKAPRTRTTPATTTNTTSVTNAQLQAMIDQGVTAALAAHDANRSTNGEDNHNSGTGVRRTERVAREMFPKESDKIERYVSGLPDMIHGNIIASRPKTMQDAIEMATELMDKKISTLAERQAENKRKLDNNNQSQQQSPKRQNVQAAPQWAMYCKVRELKKGHYKSDCPELKNQNHGNQAEGTRACEVVHALRGGEIDQDPNNIEDEIEA
ncbi:hypothetical protein Tco_1417439 [Tanacetum coccineum]